MDWTSMFYQNWQGIARTVIVTPLAYASLVAFLRISGKRTLSKLNAFDLVVTIALGSTLSAILLQESIALAEGATALALLIALQFIVTFTSVRSRTISKLVRSDPTLLVRNGEFCRGSMRAQRITEGEAMSAARQSGASDIGAVEFMVLESDGSISVGLAK